MRLGLLALWFAASASAQVLSVGVRGGLPLTDAIHASVINASPIFAGVPGFGGCRECATQRTLPYIVGPAVEVRLVKSFSLDVEALYSRVDYNYTTASFPFGPPAVRSAFFNAAKHVVDRWEFPVLFKYTMNPGRRFHPFVELGISTQRSREHETEGLAGFAFQGVIGPPSGSIQLSRSSAVNRALIMGGTFGIGASYGTRRVRPSMEFRYTRWFDKAFTVDAASSFPGSTAPHTAYSVMNQAQFLVGVVF